MRCLRDMTSRISNFTVQHNNNKRLKSRGSYVQCTHMNASTAYIHIQRRALGSSNARLIRAAHFIRSIREWFSKNKKSSHARNLWKWIKANETKNCVWCACAKNDGWGSEKRAKSIWAKEGNRLAKWPRTQRWKQDSHRWMKWLAITRCLSIHCYYILICNDYGLWFNRRRISED